MDGLLGRAARLGRATGQVLGLKLAEKTFGPGFPLQAESGWAAPWNDVVFGSCTKRRRVVFCGRLPVSTEWRCFRCETTSFVVHLEGAFSRHETVIPWNWNDIISEGPKGASGTHETTSCFISGRVEAPVSESPLVKMT
jgi:hypothetical protein